VESISWKKKSTSKYQTYNHHHQQQQKSPLDFSPVPPMQVALHHEELLSQVKNLKELETILEVVRTGVESLQSSLEKIATDISEPYLLIKVRGRTHLLLLFLCSLFFFAHPFSPEQNSTIGQSSVCVRTAEENDSIFVFIEETTRSPSRWNT
jgi:hypothetical protein